MNIRVDLNYPIKDGTEVVFRSPVDCSQVTGLKVYYDNGNASQEFVFADAHGNNVGDIDHLFAENVAVKVILDVTTGMAFVQNADTNAYLEGKFVETIDKCCTSFTESGAIVTCEPVEGYPLNVVTHIEPVQAGSGIPSPDNVRPITGWTGAKLWRGGKNLCSLGTLAFTQTDNLTFSTPIPVGRYTLSCICTSTDTDADKCSILMFAQDGSLSCPYTIILPRSTARERISVVFETTKPTVYATCYASLNGWVDSEGDAATFADIQIEAGSIATEYEPYRGEDFTIDFGQTVYGGRLNWKTGVLTVDAVCGVIARDKIIASEGDTYYYSVTDYLGMPNPIATGDAAYRRYCNYFEPYYNVANYPEFDGKIAIFDNGIIRIKFDSSWTQEQETAWLDTHEIAISYPVEPTTVQLTPQEVLALSGRNTLYSDTGDTTVTGKADPTAVIEKLTNAIIALGGNV